MPLPSDEKIIQLSNDLLAKFDALSGFHPGFRPVHAKGAMLSGTFTPSPEGRSLSRAPHLLRQSTPVTVRFSNRSGLPPIPDNAPDAGPRGCAIRFHLDKHIHTDIIGRSIDGFPTRTGQEFLDPLRAAESGDPSKFFATHWAALAYVRTLKPNPVSFATESYFGVTAFRFTNPDGVIHYLRYRIVPGAGVAYLDDAAAKEQGENYLFEELGRRIAAGPIRLEIRVQVANEGDVVDDSTIHWPADRRVVSLGEVELTAKADDDDGRIIFDPIPCVDGIQPSDDRLLELRAAIYLLSGRRRRQASALSAPVEEVGTAR
jgi:catalase